MLLCAVASVQAGAYSLVHGCMLMLLCSRVPALGLASATVARAGGGVLLQRVGMHGWRLWFPAFFCCMPDAIPCVEC